MDKHEFAREMTRFFEEVAREEAKRIGFDMAKEKNALFRMLMVVMADERLRKDAIARFKRQHGDAETHRTL